ncbi:MAG: hypothetical protein ACXWQO_14980, partial [Bdellovibrionota bacterium]
MQKLLPNLAISICVTAFLVLATYKISYPGLNVDELFFMNAALGDLDGTFITKKLGPIPIYSLSYLGAIKMWLYWFIFKIFNVSIISIRLPMILTSTMAVIGFFALAKKHFNERAAWMATSLLALNPTFIGATRQDYAGLEFGIQLLIFAALLGGASTALLAALCVLGLYYKISFMWWLSGILGAGLFFYPQKRRAVLISGAACAAFLLFWRWYVSFVPYVPPEFNWSGNLVRVGRIGASILEGSAFYNFL